MTLYKLLKTDKADADVLRLHLPTIGTDDVENIDFSIALHSITWNKPYALTLDVTRIDQYVESDNWILEVWTAFGELSYSHEAMLKKLGNDTIPTIEQALNLEVPSAHFADDITLNQINNVADMAHCSIMDVLNHVYTNDFAIELTPAIDNTEHEMDYRGFTQYEKETVLKYLKGADAVAHWVDGRMFGDEGGRRYIVDFTAFGECETFATIKDLVEGAEYCLSEWEKEEK